MCCTVGESVPSDSFLPLYNSTAVNNSTPTGSSFEKPTKRKILKNVVVSSLVAVIVSSVLLAVLFLRRQSRLKMFTIFSSSEQAEEVVTINGYNTAQILTPVQQEQCQTLELELFPITNICEMDMYPNPIMDQSVSKISDNIHSPLPIVIAKIIIPPPPPPPTM